MTNTLSIHKRLFLEFKFCLKIYLSLFIIQLYLYTSPPLLILILSALSIFTLFLNSHAQTTKT
jgi:hypothetical protein